MKQLMLYPTTPTRIKRAARRAWLWAWSREWFAMLFFLVVVLGVLFGLSGCATVPPGVYSVAEDRAVCEAYSQPMESCLAEQRSYSATAEALAPMPTRWWEWLDITSGVYPARRPVIILIY